MSAPSEADLELLLLRRRDELNQQAQEISCRLLENTELLKMVGSTKTEVKEPPCPL